MKNFFISVACMLFLIVPWFIYEDYSSDTIEKYDKIINSQLLHHIEERKWGDAETCFNELSSQWEKYKAVSAFFIDTQSVNDVDSTLAKTKRYIYLKDASNASAEAAYLMNSIKLIHESEQPSAGNVF